MPWTMLFLRGNFHNLAKKSENDEKTQKIVIKHEKFVIFSDFWAIFLK
jgi:hypothetical protein